MNSRIWHPKHGARWGTVRLASAVFGLAVMASPVTGWAIDPVWAGQPVCAQEPAQDQDASGQEKPPAADEAPGPADPQEGASKSDTPDKPAKGKLDPRIERAREIFKLLSDGQYEAFVATGSEDVRAKLTAPAIRRLWSGLTFRLGGFRSEVSAAMAKRGGRPVVDFTFLFERGLARIQMAIDADGHLSGLWVVKTEVDDRYDAPEYVDGTKFVEQPAHLEADPKFPLKGMLDVPFGKPPFPVVVLVPDMGPMDMDGTTGAVKVFKDLAWGLASQGVAVYRYDKRTRGYPRAFRGAEWTPERELIDDALAAVKLVRQAGVIDDDRVFVAGLGMGGVVAPAIAERDGHVAGLILLNTPCRPVLDVLEAQTKYLAKLDGTIDIPEAMQIDLLKRTAEAIRQGSMPADGKPVLGMPPEYWAGLQELDAAAKATLLKLPMLIVQGERDFQVPMIEFTAWRDRLAGLDRVRARSYPALNHLFVAGKGKSSPSEYGEVGHVSGDVVADIAAWVLSTGPAPGGGATGGKTAPKSDGPASDGPAGGKAPSKSDNGKAGQPVSGDPVKPAPAGDGDESRG